MRQEPRPGPRPKALRSLSSAIQNFRWTPARLKVAGVFIFIATSSLASFQNCSRVSITNGTQTAVTAQNVPTVSFSQTTLITNVNVPVSTKLVKASTSSSISLAQDSVQNSATITNGKVSLDLSTMTFTYTPTYGFRGSTTANIYTVNGSQTNVMTITIVVQNPSLNFNPALAVRGPQCMACHATVNGDFISDFGFKGSTDTGPDTFFKVGPSAISTPYNIDQSGQTTMSTVTLSGRLVIPNVDFTQLDSSVSRYFGFSNTASTNLKDYITNNLPPTGSSYQGIAVQNTIYIGAPLASDIVTAGTLSAATPMVFFPNAPTSPALSGFSHITSGAFDYYSNGTGTMICEGDLFVNGVVFLDHVSIQTTEGCRIYATRSVFVSGGINYVNELALSNVEITSAVGVYLGTGYCIDCDDSVTYSYANHDTLLARWQMFIQPQMPDMRTTTLANHVADIQTDLAKFTVTPTTLPAAGTTKAQLAAQGVRLLDSSNSVMGEGATSFSRVLLNAPDVQARDYGDFDGIVISEFALWRLEQFKFTFDPVFTGVPLFPFLNFNKILLIQ